MDVYIDIDGTLIDKDDIVRPRVADFFQGLTMRGCKIIIWSGGGITYAERHIHRILTWIDYSTKQKNNISVEVIAKDFRNVRYKDYRSFVIDDQLPVVEMFKDFGGGGYKVPFYESTLMEDDEALIEAYHEISRHERANGN